MSPLSDIDSFVEYCSRLVVTQLVSERVIRARLEQLAGNPMVTLVFDFLADAGLMPAALDELRARLPDDASVIPKTQTVVVVDVPDGTSAGKLEQVRHLFGGAWDIHSPAYAEIRPLTPGLAAVRKKLGR